MKKKIKKEKKKITKKVTRKTRVVKIARKTKKIIRKKEEPIKVKKFAQNPIISPSHYSWESKATFNPAAIYENGKVHILYRAMSNDDTSVFGYASSIDGFHINERLNFPVYIPREDFERKKGAGNSGCEDPRITKIDDKFYMFYTAFDGINPPRVAMTSINVLDFLNKKWNWDVPKLISPPNMDDKDACLLPEKINDRYVIFHRLEASIWIDFVDDLNFEGEKYLGGNVLFQSRADKWDNGKIGIASPPVKTEYGWLLLYHGISEGNYYKVSAVLLDLNNPAKILSRLNGSIFEPEMSYEKEGQYANVVFPCGTVVLNNKLFVYYGGADSVTGVATVDINNLLKKITGNI